MARKSSNSTPLSPSSFYTVEDENCNDIHFASIEHLFDYIGGLIRKHDFEGTGSLTVEIRKSDFTIPF